MSERPEPIPVGTVVDYHGSLAHGRYVVTGHDNPQNLFPYDKWHLLAEAYPDGVAYTIWPEGMEQRWANRAYSAYRVRRGSLEVAS